MPALRLFTYIEVVYDNNQRTGKPDYVIYGKVSELVDGVELCRTESKQLAELMAGWWSAQVQPIAAPNLLRAVN